MHEHNVNGPHPLIIDLAKNFIYPNKSLVTVGHRGLDNQGSTVHVLYIGVCMYVCMYSKTAIYNLSGQSL